MTEETIKESHESSVRPKAGEWTSTRSAKKDPGVGGKMVEIRK